MKTVVVILEFQPLECSNWLYVTENSVFGEDTPYQTANDFINSVKEMHQKHSYKYKILNVVIG